MTWDVIISSFHYIIFITSRSSQFNEVLLPAWQQFLKVGNKSSLLQRALCILFSWFPVGGNGGCRGSCMKSLSCFCSLCLSALALQRIRHYFTALLAFFWHLGLYQTGAWLLASTAEKEFCWHDRVRIAVDLLLCGDGSMARKWENGVLVLLCLRHLTLLPRACVKGLSNWFCPTVSLSICQFVSLSVRWKICR